MDEFCFFLTKSFHLTVTSLPFPPEGVNIHSVPDFNTDNVIETEVNKTVSLLCEPKSAQTDEELVWLRNGALVSLQEQNKKTHSSICVTPVLHEDDGAVFTCSLRKNSSASASVTLHVTCKSSEIDICIT